MKWVSATLTAILVILLGRVAQADSTLPRWPASDGVRIVQVQDGIIGSISRVRLRRNYRAWRGEVFGAWAEAGYRFDIQQVEPVTSANWYEMRVQVKEVPDGTMLLTRSGSLGGYGIIETVASDFTAIRAAVVTFPVQEYRWYMGHEVGHGLGLLHTNHPESVMNNDLMHIYTLPTAWDLDQIR